MPREELLVLVVVQARTIEELTRRVTEPERQLQADSSSSSRPPSSDTPWQRKPAKRRSARIRSGARPGRQPGAESVSRRLVEDLDAVFEVSPHRCARCERSLVGAVATARVRRQVVDVSPPAPRG
jgi:transposase